MGAAADPAPHKDVVVELGLPAEPAAVAQAGPPRAGAGRPRMYWMDWLRVFMVITVIAYHAYGTFVEEQVDMWSAQVPDVDAFTSTLWSLWGPPTTAYRMGLFFVLAGFCTPGSYNRKGPRKHVWDRTLRLLLPCIIVSMLFWPIMAYINDTSHTTIARLTQEAADAVEDDDETPEPIELPTLRDEFANYYTLSEFNIANGPIWFAYMLWWFDVAYVLLRVFWASRGGRWFRQCCCGLQDRLLPQKPSGRGACVPAESSDSDSGDDTFALRSVLLFGAALILVFWGLQFMVRMIMYEFPETFPDPSNFWHDFIFLNFAPADLPRYAICFALGIVAKRHDALRRLPGQATWWCLCCAGIWWVLVWPLLASWPGLEDELAGWGTHPRPAPLVAYWAFHSFVESSFSVVWGYGILTLFRDTFNNKPGRVGAIINGANYASYLVHPMLVTLMGRALEDWDTWSMHGHAVWVGAITIVSSYILGAGLKAIPGASRVL